MSRLAIIAGEGWLPEGLAEADPKALVISLTGRSSMASGNPVRPAGITRLGEIFALLAAEGITEVSFAGAMTRPDMDPSNFDPETLALLPRLMPRIASGDDALFRELLAIFGERGFAVRAAAEIRPDLVAPPGLLAGSEPSAANLADAGRATEILETLAPLDLGQGAVVAGGLCLGIETLQGTDAMLRFVAATPPHLRRGRGVFVKRPKTGQDLRIDMPAIGPGTVDLCAAAGLAGIVVAAGQVLILEPQETRARAAAAGLFLWAQ